MQLSYTKFKSFDEVLNFAVLAPISTPYITLFGTEVPVLGEWDGKMLLAHQEYDQSSGEEWVTFGGFVTELETYLDNCDREINSEVIRDGLITVFTNRATE